ncbi:MAG: hypothetical protein V1849_01055 [Chloroflexota bacterium]
MDAQTEGGADIALGCYVCGSTKFVDKHHLDCREGEVSGEVIPLCRRCHRSYHDFGVGCFSPSTTGRILEVENRRRVIVGLPLMLESEIHRSGYWRGKWGIPRAAKQLPRVAGEQLRLLPLT